MLLVLNLSCYGCLVRLLCLGARAQHDTTLSGVRHSHGAIRHSSCSGVLISDIGLVLEPCVSLSRVPVTDNNNQTERPDCI